MVFKWKVKLTENQIWDGCIESDKFAKSRIDTRAAREPICQTVLFFTKSTCQIDTSNPAQVHLKSKEIHLKSPETHLKIRFSICQIDARGFFRGVRSRRETHLANGNSDRGTRTVPFGKWAHRRKYDLGEIQFCAILAESESNGLPNIFKH